MSQLEGLPAEWAEWSTPTGARPGVVAGADGSRAALDAVRWAAAEAALRRLPLLIVHASPPLETRRRLLGIASTIAWHSQPGIDVATDVVSGDARGGLLAAAGPAQILAVGCSRSLAAAVAAGSPCPVAVVRGRWARPEGRPVVVGIRSASIGAGFPGRDGIVLSIAVAAAARARCGLVVVHADPDDRPARTRTRSRAQQIAAALVHVTRVTGPARAVDVQVHTPRDRPAVALLRAAATARAIVVGDPTGRIGQEVLADSPVPVVLVGPAVGPEPHRVRPLWPARADPHDLAELW